MYLTPYRSIYEYFHNPAIHMIYVDSTRTPDIRISHKKNENKTLTLHNIHYTYISHTSKTP